eukprot:CAMPEP_0115875116 /NCGR_PEP_ID=MMETSP0287-20121206/24918_1 /TAXON_ID=412157 /ORGANISM="Chrysochromulina rotalis, Strain UIO044" /LENGTH=146 /DNA_ID=CAMNT_0003330343 /DNA_START=275 /DNA_END=712 /DNA_ORIENTATION=+
MEADEPSRALFAQAPPSLAARGPVVLLGLATAVLAAAFALAVLASSRASSSSAMRSGRLRIYSGMSGHASSAASWAAAAIEVRAGKFRGCDVRRVADGCDVRRVADVDALPLSSEPADACETEPPRGLRGSSHLEIFDPVEVEGSA